MAKAARTLCAKPCTMGEKQAPAVLGAAGCSTEGYRLNSLESAGLECVQDAGPGGIYTVTAFVHTVTAPLHTGYRLLHYVTYGCRLLRYIRLQAPVRWRAFCSSHGFSCGSSTSRR